MKPQISGELQIASAAAVQIYTRDDLNFYAPPVRVTIAAALQSDIGLPGRVHVTQ